MWRGPPLAEFAYDSFARAEATRLEELRLEAHEARAEADLALGAHAQLVPELEALLAQHPLRERVAGQLMTALYRTGRQGDACRVFYATRTALIEELGIEPEPPLRELLQRILDHDPLLAIEPCDGRARPTRRHQRVHNLPAEPTSFVGREHELEEIHSRLNQPVTVLCRRLDGIPLAIELAAARARALSPAEVVERLGDRFGLLTGGGRDALPRQQTLRATIDWSHALLGPAERALFRRLSVFAGGWTLASAEEVCSDGQLPPERICDVLGELVAKSLVSADSAGGAPTRYRMLETLRAYADERLTDAGERSGVAHRHLGHFLALAETAHQQRQTRGLNAELRIIRSEQDNIRAALAFARADDAPSMLRLATASEQLWLAGHINEGLRWLRDALLLAPHPTPARVRALTTAAALTTLQQARADARRLVDESLTLAAAIRDRAGEAGARLWLGFLELNADPPAYSELERSLTIHEEVGDRVGVCHSPAIAGSPQTTSTTRSAPPPSDRYAARPSTDWPDCRSRTTQRGPCGCSARPVRYANATADSRPRGSGAAPPPSASRLRSSSPGTPRARPGTTAGA